MHIFRPLCALINHRYNFLPHDNDAIISFESPHLLRELCILEAESELIRDHPIDQQLFHIRMANSEDQREAASLLIKKRYSWRGYSVDMPVANEPNRITLIAETENKIVGTMTLCLDGDSLLPADENFGDKLNELRAKGRRLSEPSRLAIDDNVPKRVFASLIHICYIYAANIHGFTDWVIEVNPRHAGFYKRMLGFREIAEERVCTRVDAPAVLLRLKLEYMAEQIGKFGGLMEQHGNERSFYPYFFSGQDEYGITERLKTGRAWVPSM
jgi:hypothetical protein